MNSILEGETKILTLGPSSGKDNTSEIESRIQRRLLQLHKDDLLPANLYDLIWPTGSQRPRIYGLPKTHKKDVPLWPILSMTGSLQHQLAKYLPSLLEPVLTLCSSNCIRDSFTFADIIKTSNLDPSSVFLCSFDISSLFTNVPLAESIQICADALCSSEHPAAPFPRQIFVELMEMATSCVEFSFNDIMHRQIDGVAMGSPPGRALANIFVGYYESKLFQITSNSEMYYRCMDDTFVVFRNEDECDLFLNSLNSLHPSLRFTFEKESNLALPFLDVLVEKSLSKFITSIYRKLTFTGQYLHWNSFSPRKLKTNLILALTHRALAICSHEKLPSELDKIKFILLTNGYPEHVIKSFKTMKIKQFNACPNLDPKNAPSIYVSHGSVLFLPGLKSKWSLLSNSAFPLWNHMLFTLPTSFSPVPTRMYCLLYRKATWFIISHATVTVGM